MLAVPFSVSGQEAPIRPDCQEMMSKADALLVKPQPPLKEALRLYLSAQNCDNRLSSQVSRKIEDIFDRIEQQRKNEAAARQEAFRQTRKAEIETIRATGAALSATARQKYTEDHTIALNLAIHSYQLSPTPENADAIRDFLQDSSGNSIFYQNFLGDSDYIHHLPMGAINYPHYVRSVSWSPDGEKFVSGSSDSTATIWEVKSGKPLRKLLGHRNRVLSVAWSPDSRWIFTGGEDNIIFVWDAGTGIIVDSLKDHNRDVNGLVFSNDGKKILSGGREGKALIWDVESRKIICSIPRYNYGLCWSPDDSRVLTGHGNNIYIWDAENGAPLDTLSGHSEYIRTLDWSPNGSKILSGSRDNTVRKWEWDSLAKEWMASPAIQAHRGEVLSVAWSPDGDTFLTASFDSTTLLWDTKTGNQTGALMGHKGYVLSADWSPDGTKIVTGAHDNTAKVWQWKNKIPLQKSIESAYETAPLAWSPDGRRIISSNRDDGILIWEVKSGRLLDTLEGHTGSVKTLTWSPDGSKILTGSTDDTAVIWEAETGTPVDTLKGHDGTVMSVAWSTDGKKIATGSYDETIIIWEKQQGKWQATLTLDAEEDLKYIAWSADDNHILTAADHEIRMWDLNGSSQRLIEYPERTYILAIDLSPDKSKLITKVNIPGGASGYVEIVVWDLTAPQPGKMLTITEKSNYGAKDVLWSADSRLFLTAGDYYNSAKVWDSQTGALLYEITQAEDREDIIGLAWSPDGRKIATRTENEVIIWNFPIREIELGYLYRLTKEELKYYGIDWEY